MPTTDERRLAQGKCIYNFFNSERCEKCESKNKCTVSVRVV